MQGPLYILAKSGVPYKSDLPYLWDQATPEGKAIIVALVIFSIFAWTVMASKAMQMRRGKKVNGLFEAEVCTQKKMMGAFDRRGGGGGWAAGFGFLAGGVGRWIRALKRHAAE